MQDLLTNLAFGVALLAFTGWVVRRWVLALEPPPDMRATLQGALLGITFVGGLLGGVGWWFDAPGSFPWDLPPLAGRLLGAAAWSFALVTLLALHRPTGARLRLVNAMLLVYLGPLAIAILVQHLDRFDMTAPITWSFLGTVVTLLGATLWFLARPAPLVADGPMDSAPSRVDVRRWLSVVAVITGAWGLALFVTDQGPIGELWVWPGDLLTSRLIASMLLTVAAAATLSRGLADTGRLVQLLTLAYGLGAVLAGLWNATAGKPIPWLYIALFGILVVGSATRLRITRSA